MFTLVQSGEQIPPRLASWSCFAKSVAREYCLDHHWRRHRRRGRHPPAIVASPRSRRRSRAGQRAVDRRTTPVRRRTRSTALKGKPGLDGSRYCVSCVDERSRRRRVGGGRRRAMAAMAVAKRSRQPHGRKARAHRVQRHLRGAGGLDRTPATQPVALAVTAARPSSNAPSTRHGVIDAGRSQRCRAVTGETPPCSLHGSFRARRPRLRLLSCADPTPVVVLRPHPF